MPLLRIDSLPQDTLLCVWQMTEADSALPVPNSVDMSAIGSQARKREKQVAYAMLGLLTGNHELIIEHEPSGKPLVEGYNISITHTRGWAAMILSRKCRVAVDVEYNSSRVNKIASRFIREDEQNDSLERRLVNWCAKETMYKLFSEEDLAFFNMRVRPYVMSSQGVICADDLITGQAVSISYEVNSEFVLAYAQLL